MSDMKFREWLKAELEKRNLTIYRLSLMSSVPKHTLYRIMTGSHRIPSLETVEKIAVAFGYEKKLFWNHF